MVRAANLANDPVLTRFRAVLDVLYGDRLERAVLFGSRARGDARPDSDYDVAVFLRNYHGFWNEVQRLSSTFRIVHRPAVIPRPRRCPLKR